MKRVEYKYVGWQTEKQLNAWGQMGWRLVAISRAMVETPGSKFTGQEMFILERDKDCERIAVYRGSGSDLATDVFDLLPEKERVRFVEKWRSLTGALS